MLDNLVAFVQHPAVVGILTLSVSEFVRRSFTRGDRKKEDAAQIREELWDELRSLRTYVERVERELDEWKEKYFKLMEEKVEMVRAKAASDALNIRLIDENSHLRVMLADAGVEPPPPVE